MNNLITVTTKNGGEAINNDHVQRAQYLVGESTIKVWFGRRLFARKLEFVSSDAACRAFHRIAGLK